MENKSQFDGLLKNRQWVWVVVVAIIIIFSCAVLTIGGGWWLGHRVAQKTEQKTGETAATVAIPSPAVTALKVILSTREPPTDTPAPTRTAISQPTATPTAASGPSLGDRLSLPTATPTSIPEGVIVFLSSRNYDPQESSNRKRDLFAMNIDGSNQVMIDISADPQQLGYYGLYPYYKPNQIVEYSHKRNTSELSFTVYDISQLNHIDLRPIDTNSEIKISWTPSWSKTGDTVFAGFLPNDEWVIYFLGHNQNDARQLTFPPNDSANEVYGDTFPVWSPDGEWIAFSRTWYSSESDGVWLMRPDGSDAHRIVAMNTRAIAWSPDGTKLAFQGRPVNSGFDIWVTDADGSKQKQLSFFPEKDFGIYDWPIAWSPDSKQIVFQVTDKRVNRDYSGQLYIVDDDGNSEPSQLTFEGDFNGSPIWLPISMDKILANAPTPAPSTPTPKPAAPPPPPAPSSCPSPGAQITSPRAGTWFTHRYNHILGTANINRFNRWKLEYSTDPNGGWQYLFERNYPVINGELMMFDASTVPQGPYGLRLTVIDETGNYPEPCVIWFTNGY